MAPPCKTKETSKANQMRCVRAQTVESWITRTAGFAIILKCSDCFYDEFQIYRINFKKKKTL